MAQKGQQCFSSDSEDELSTNSSGAFSFLSNLSGQEPILAKPWAKSKQCHICNKPLGKLHGSLRHHCRFCGETVCKYHSQHSQAHPLTAESVRCCDSCYKSLVCSSLKADIAQYIAEVKGRIAEVNGDLVRVAKDTERKDVAVRAMGVEVQRKRQGLEESRAIYEERIDAVRGTGEKLKAITANNRENCTYSTELLQKVREKHAEKHADYTELLSEVANLRSDIEAEQRQVTHQHKLLRGRIPMTLVGKILGTCCQPKYFGVSFSSTGGFDVAKFKESLYSSRGAVMRGQENKKCLCILS